MFDIFDIFNNSDFFQVPTVYKEEVRCPVCGISYSDFRKSGKLGCSHCYETFKNSLSQVLRQIHQNPVHTGKLPGSVSAELLKKRKISELKEKLQSAVRSENYEEAAKLHKEILELEKGAEK